MPIDIRLICATNVPLTELANENRFRDLIYRINTVRIAPLLRKREEDIVSKLARHFVELACINNKDRSHRQFDVRLDGKSRVTTGQKVRG